MQALQRAAEQDEGRRESKRVRLSCACIMHTTGQFGSGTARDFTVVQMPALAELINFRFHEKITKIQRFLRELTENLSVLEVPIN